MRGTLRGALVAVSLSVVHQQIFRQNTVLFCVMTRGTWGREGAGEGRGTGWGEGLREMTLVLCSILHQYLEMAPYSNSVISYTNL